MKPSAREGQMRIRLAEEAARIMIEDGIRDFHAAKRKAAEHLGVSHTKNLPRNQEIEQARLAYQRLFLGDQTQQRQHQLLLAATKAMALLDDFDPRLTGQVLETEAAPNAIVELHLRTDTPELVAVFLQQHGIPFDQHSATLRFGHDRSQTLPGYAFVAGDVTIELTIFDRDSHQPPLSRVTGKPQRRARRAEVEAMLVEAA